MAEPRCTGLLSVFIALVLSLTVGCGLFRDEDPDFREGIAHFGESDWVRAEESFDRALEREPSLEAHFNRGAALYRQGRFEEAGEDLRRAVGTRDELLRSRTYLGLGNNAASSGDIDSAIESYRRALELNPSDHDARYNLEWALWMKEQAESGDDGGDSGSEGDDSEGEGDDGGEDRDGSGEGEEKHAGNDSQDDDSKGEGDESGDDGESGGKHAQNDQDESTDEPGSDGESEGEGDDDSGADGQHAQNQDDPSSPPDASNDRASSNESEEDDGQPQGMAQGAQGDTADESPARPMSRQEVSEVLDALRAGEQSIPLWRFEQGERRQRERGNRERDW